MEENTSLALGDKANVVLAATTLTLLTNCMLYFNTLHTTWTTPVVIVIILCTLTIEDRAPRNPDDVYLH